MKALRRGRTTIHAAARYGVSFAASALILLSLGTGIAAASATPTEVSEYMDRFGVTADRAEQVLEVQHRAAEVDIVGQLENLLGADYAGVWFDNEKGEFVVPLVPGVGPALVRTLFAHLGIQDELRIARARSSWSELERGQERLNRQIMQLASDGLIRTSLDPRTNSLWVESAQALRGAKASKLRERLSTLDVDFELRDRKLERFDPVAAACGDVEDTPSCDLPLRGGVAIGQTAVNGPGTGGKECTAGFKAIGRSNGNRYVLTAGHCIDELQYFKADTSAGPMTGERYLGFVEQVHWGNGADVAKINATGSYWDTSPWPNLVVDWGSKGWGPPVNPAHPITSEGRSFVGQQACHSGITTGTHCSIVTKMDLMVSYFDSAANRQITYKHLSELYPICVDNGDSGGPVYAGNTALGIVSAKDGELPQCGNYLLYSEITEDTDLLNVSVAPRVSEVSAPVFDEDDNSPGPRALADVDGTVDVFFRDTNGDLGHHWYVPGNGWAVETRDTSIAPSAVPRVIESTDGTEDVTSKNGQIVHAPRVVHAFFRDTNGDLGHHWYVPGKDWAVETRDASMASDPNIVAHGDGTVNVFFRDTNGDLGHHWYVPGNDWAVETRDTSMTSDPHVVKHANGIVDVFFRDTNGDLGHHWYVPGKGWSVETRDTSIRAGAEPQVSAQGNGIVDVFFRDVNGDLGHHSYVPGNGWSVETRQASMASDPRVVAQPNGTVDVFFRDTNGDLGHHSYVQGNGWSVETRDASMASVPRVIARTNGVVNVFFRDVEGDLGHHWYVPGQGWSVETRDASMASAPQLAAQLSGVVNVFFRDTNGNLGNHWYVPGKGWAVETRPAAISAPHAPVLGVVTSGGELLAKAGHLSAEWVKESGGVKDVSIATDPANGPLIGIVTESGDAYVKKGLFGVWVKQASGVADITVASASGKGPLIGILKTGGTALVKQGDLYAPWVQQASSVQSLSLASDAKNGPLIGILTAGGNVHIKQGDLYSPWVQQASSVQSLSLASDAANGPLIGILTTGGNVHIKQGDLYAPWVQQASSVQSLSLASDPTSGPMIGMIKPSGSTFVKQGDLYASWVHVKSAAQALALGSDSGQGGVVAVIGTDGHAYAKEAGLYGPWVDLSGGAQEIAVAG